jgi:hypothetical protein
VAERDQRQQLQARLARAQQLLRQLMQAQAPRHLAQLGLRFPAQRLLRPAPEHEERLGIARRQHRQWTRDAFGALREQRVPKSRGVPLASHAPQQAPADDDGNGEQTAGRDEHREGEPQRSSEQRVRNGAEGQAVRPCAGRGRLARASKAPGSVPTPG